VLQAAEGRREKISIYGDDYDTPDGTCIRDYVHVLDLAQAHLLALESDFCGSLNLGSGTGYSVKQVIDTVRAVTGREVPVQTAPRRPGDPPRLIADASTARRVLGWQPQYDDLSTIIASAWRWRQLHPQGYQD